VRALLRTARQDQLLSSSALVFLTTVLMAAGGAAFWVIAARLSSAAKSGQILLSPGSFVAVEGLFDVEDLGELQLKGFSHPIATVNVLGVRARGRLVAAATAEMPGEGG